MPPRTVRIAGQRIRVTLHDELHVLKADGTPVEGAIGCCDLVHDEIGLANYLGPERERETLLHECLHGLLGKMGYTLERSDDEEEALVKRLSPLLLDFIRSNPRLVAYLSQRGSGNRSATSRH